MLGVVPSLVRAWREYRCLCRRRLVANRGLQLHRRTLQPPRLPLARPPTRVTGRRSSSTAAGPRSAAAMSPAPWSNRLHLPPSPPRRSGSTWSSSMAPVNRSPMARRARSSSFRRPSGCPRRCSTATTRRSITTTARPDPAGEVLRRHGDQLARLPGGFYRAQGRADDTMNLGGIKVSSLELERVIDHHPANLRVGGGRRPTWRRRAPRSWWSSPSPRSTRTPNSSSSTFDEGSRSELNPLFKIHDLVLVDSSSPYRLQQAHATHVAGIATGPEGNRNRGSGSGSGSARAAGSGSGSGSGRRERSSASASLHLDLARVRCLALVSPRNGAWHRSHRVSRGVSIGYPDPMQIDDLSTPSAVVDLDRLERNATRMADHTHRLGVRLRPHVKTHKCVEAARIQVRDHFGGITVSTLAEARGFAQAGFRRHHLRRASRTAETGRGRRDQLEDRPPLGARRPHGDHHRHRGDRAVARRWSSRPGSRSTAASTAPGSIPRSSLRWPSPPASTNSAHIDFRGVLTHAGQSYAAANREEALAAAETSARSPALS